METNKEFIKRKNAQFAKKEKDICKMVEKFLIPVQIDQNHRNRSWEHCYLFFKKNRHRLANKPSAELLDLASLNIAFYLASWGMYRGSTWVLWKDYKIYKESIRILLEKKYAHLWDLGFPLIEREDTINKTIEEIMALKTEIFDSLKEYSKKRKPSDTLISKILLGVNACVPAFDKFFKTGSKKKFRKALGFNKKSLNILFKFCGTNKSDIKKAKTRANILSKINYPIIKIVDMYFWQIASKEKATSR